AKTLEQIAAENQPDTVKVFNLLKNIHELVSEKAAQQPLLINIGDKAEEIARAFQDRQKTTKDTLPDLDHLGQELPQAEQRQKETALSAEAFAVFWLLQRQEVPKAIDVARGIATAFEQFPPWQTSERQEQDVRKEIYKALINADVVDGVKDLTDAI